MNWLNKLGTAFCAASLGVVSGCIFLPEDTTINGAIFEAGEGQAGAIMLLTGDVEFLQDGQMLATSSDSVGSYSYTELTPGSYTVRPAPEPNYKYYPQTRTVVANGGQLDGLDFIKYQHKLWFADGDGDGFGNPGVSVDSETQPEGSYVESSTDCNDADAGINPAAEEIAHDGVDQNCDGSDSAVWFADEDGDGFGNAEMSVIALIGPDGYVTKAGDCDDTDAEINPGVLDIPDDDIAQNCGALTYRFYVDFDEDGYGAGTPLIGTGAPSGPINFVQSQAGDCDDSNAEINPEVLEIVGDGIDQDCDGIDSTVWFIDADGDGFGVDGEDNLTGETQPEGYVSTKPAGYSVVTVDCDDEDAGVNPDAEEIPGDEIDQNCDGEDSINWYTDTDDDGFGTNDVDTEGNVIVASNKPDGFVAIIGDCDDEIQAINPTAEEIPDDGVDQNCDGYDTHLWYRDFDGDGVGDAEIAVAALHAPPGYVAAAEPADCDDSVATVYPGAEEVPADGVDQDCDGSDSLTWYYDGDLDGYGTPTTTMISETQPEGYVPNGRDCRDDDPLINPNAIEIRDDNIDQNCNFYDLAKWYNDIDGDGYGEAGLYTYFEGPQSNYSQSSNDCNDHDASIHPGAVDTPDDGIDQDCDALP